ncbi:SipW-dependent-type signal peptide-containing protein [Arthrobacter sp. NPDC057013]|uniref:SipW-dependent-type signal peptide-containing protein n=1 Tax=Arthrobacter sp. NPDC057013 TaxID=3345999 RepID=UPI00362868A6
MSQAAARMRSRTFTRVRAVLAGALVLGVGASVTLASWTDSEYAAGAFTASTFRLESSTQTTDWRDSTSAADASLTVNATGLSPGASGYSWLNVRTTAASTVGGTVVLTSSTPVGDLSPQLEYRAVLTSAATTCDASAFSGTPLFIAGSASAYLPASAVGAPPVSSPITAAGNSPVRYCFDMRIKTGADNSFQGKSATVTWLFTGTSN